MTRDFTAASFFSGCYPVSGGQLVLCLLCTLLAPVSLWRFLYDGTIRGALSHGSILRSIWPIIVGPAVLWVPAGIVSTRNNHGARGTIPGPSELCKPLMGSSVVRRKNQAFWSTYKGSGGPWQGQRLPSGYFKPGCLIFTRGSRECLFFFRAGSSNILIYRTEYFVELWVLGSDITGSVVVGMRVMRFIRS